MDNESGTAVATSDFVVLPNGKTERALLSRAIAEIAEPGQPLRVLEAGCGQKWGISVAGVPLHITGVDTDAEAMRIRREQQADLDEEIVGDLRSVELPAAAYDVTYCSYVLEHVEGAEAVLDRLVAATRPGGRIIIRVPDGDTVYGFAVKHSPHRVHVLYKRYVERFPDAGKPGHAPYPTIYDPVITLAGLREYGRRHGLTVVEEYGVMALPAGLGRLRPLVVQVMRALAWLSRGRLTGTHVNIGLVLERPRTS